MSNRIQQANKLRVKKAMKNSQILS